MPFSHSSGTVPSDKDFLYNLHNGFAMLVKIFFKKYTEYPPGPGDELAVFNLLITLMISLTLHVKGHKLSLQFRLKSGNLKVLLSVLNREEKYSEKK